MVHEDYVTDLERTGDALASLIRQQTDGKKKPTVMQLSEAVSEFQAVRDQARGYGRF